MCAPITARHQIRFSKIIGDLSRGSLRYLSFTSYINDDRQFDLRSWASDWSRDVDRVSSEPDECNFDSPGDAEPQLRLEQDGSVWITNGKTISRISRLGTKHIRDFYSMASDISLCQDREASGLIFASCH